MAGSSINPRACALSTEGHILSTESNFWDACCKLGSINLLFFREVRIVGEGAGLLVAKHLWPLVCLSGFE